MRSSAIVSHPWALKSEALVSQEGQDINLWYKCSILGSKYNAYPDFEVPWQVAPYWNQTKRGKWKQSARLSRSGIQLILFHNKFQVNYQEAFVNLGYCFLRKEPAKYQLHVLVTQIPSCNSIGYPPSRHWNCLIGWGECGSLVHRIGVHGGTCIQQPGGENLLWEKVKIKRSLLKKPPCCRRERK